MRMRVRALGPDDADEYVALRRRALVEAPEVFASSLEDDHTADPERVRATLAHELPLWSFGAYDGDTLVGLITLGRGAKRKTEHRGELYGMFVAPEARGLGVGMALLKAALGQARELGLRCVALSVANTGEAARALYESAGFERWGTDPAALMIDGELVAADAMIRWLR